MENKNSLTRVLFRLGGRSWTWQHVLACADHTGELAPRLARFQCAQAAVAEAMSRGDCLPDRALPDAITEWRYAFNLISAKETEDWLASHSLEITDLGEHINCELWRQELPDSGGSTDLALPELSRALWAQVAFSGELPALVHGLVQRVLCAELLTPPDDELPPIRGACFLGDLAVELAPLEAAYQHCLAEFANHEACSRAIGMLRPDLLRIRYQSATFATQDAACEARLCVRDDGESLAAVAERVSASTEEGVVFASDVDRATATRLLSAAVGECTQPNESHSIYVVLGKIEPVLSDLLVAKRAQRHCLASKLNPHLSKIEWVGCPAAT
ncbi:MAG: hypothetical protein ACI8W8_003945 [Rhodothermales bacterium]|jgi:hypothetical protein